MKDSSYLITKKGAKITKSEYQMQIFIWEVIGTTIVFIGIYLILKKYKKQKDTSANKNKKFYSGEQ